MKKSKKNSTNTLKLALKKLGKETSKLPDKKKSIGKTSASIRSSTSLKQSCDKLMNYLHQRMHHALALKVNDVSKLINDKMSQKAIDEVTDSLKDIASKNKIDISKL